MNAANPSGRTLSYGEQKSLESKIQDHKDALGGKEVLQGLNVNSPNVVVSRREIKRLEGILSSQGIGEISEEERGKIAVELKALTADLQKGMPSWDRYISSRPKDGPRHDRMINWINTTNADPVRQQKIKRWKTLRRYLDPHNPKASHVMHLFPGSQDEF